MPISLMRLTQVVTAILGIVVVCAVTILLLETARYLGGRPAMWGVGFAVLLFAAFALIRRRE